MNGKSFPRYVDFAGDLPILVAYCRISKKIISLACSSGHVECSFDHPANFFALSPKKVSNISRESCSLELLLGLIECSFENPNENLLVEVLKVKKSKILKSFFSPKCSSGPVECSFDNTSRKYFAYILGSLSNSVLLLSFK